LEPYRDGLLVEALETAPGYRRRGYAEALLRQVLGSFAGKKIYSHVDKTNIPSLRLHEKCGFSRISECAAYIDGSINSRACTLCYEARKK
jgi:ribosomal protein S18 acetylase RimI-like enzyme